MTDEKHLPETVPGTYWVDSLKRFVTPYDADWKPEAAERLAGYVSGTQRMEAQRIHANSRAGSAGPPDMTPEELEAYALEEHADVLGARDADGGSVGAHGDAGLSMVLSELRQLRVAAQSQNELLEAFTKTLPDDQKEKLAELLSDKAKRLKAGSDDEAENGAEE